MRRRDFIKILAASAASLPVTARAQRAAMPVIGFLNSGSPDPFRAHAQCFPSGFERSRLCRGPECWPSNIAGRTANTIACPHWLANSVQHRVSVIAATSTPANLVAKASIISIPIVFTTGGDPVQLDLVASLSRPGGNVTGVTQMTGEVAPKRVELARRIGPAGRPFWHAHQSENPLAEFVKRNLLAAALKLGIKLNILYVSADVELEELSRRSANRVPARS